MWHKAIWKGHPMRLELTRVDLLVELANNYTTRGACLGIFYVYGLGVFVPASHQRGLDTRSMTRRSIIEGIYGRGRSSMRWCSIHVELCWSLVNLVQCEPDGYSWSWTQIWVQSRMPDYCLNWTARCSAIQRRQKGQWCSSPTKT